MISRSASLFCTSHTCSRAASSSTSGSASRLTSAGRVHPVERLVGAVVGVDRDRPVRLEQDEPLGHRQVRRQAAGVVDLAAGNHETHPGKPTRYDRPHGPTSQQAPAPRAAAVGVVRPCRRQGRRPLGRAGGVPAEARRQGLPVPRLQPAPSSPGVPHVVAWPHEPHARRDLRRRRPPPLAHGLLEPEALSDLHTTLGRAGTPRVAFLHGLFGQGKQLAGHRQGAVADDDPSLLLDLPNHGRSPWSDHFSYIAMADAVAADLRDRLGRSAAVTVVGHSMGGKTAMALALRHPDLVRGPRRGRHRPRRLQPRLRLRPPHRRPADLDLDRPAHRRRGGRRRPRRRGAGRRRPGVPAAEPAPRRAAGFTWLPNLDLLAESLPRSAAGPTGAGRAPTTGPVLWLRGASCPATSATSTSRP